MSQYERLPVEIHQKIVEHLQCMAEVKSASILIKITLICRRFYEVVVPVLLRNVFLDGHNLASFSRSINRACLGHISSLTISMPTREFSEENEEAMSRLVPLLRHMSSLSSFSFKLEGLIPTYPPHTAPLPARSLHSILEALPETCEALELDIEAYEWFESPETAHLCPRIRALFPQLRFIRLRLKQMCEHVLSNTSLYGHFVEQKLINPDHHKAPDHRQNLGQIQHVDLPLMQCLIINCDNTISCNFEGQRLQEKSCRNGLAMAALFSSTVPQVTLRMPALVQGFVLFRSRLPSGRNRLIFPALIRRDIKSQQSVAMPYREVTVLPVYLVFRTPEYSNAVVDRSAMHSLAESQQWVTLARPQNCRLPASRSRQYGLVQEIVWENEAEFGSDVPRRTCHLWKDELKFDQKLLEPDVRHSIHNVDPVVQKMPPGTMAMIFHEDEDDGDGNAVYTIYEQLVRDDNSACAILPDGSVRCPHGIVLSGRIENPYNGARSVSDF